MGDIKNWKLDLEAYGGDKRGALDPPGYDASFAKELVGTSAGQKKKDSSMLQRKQQALFAKATAPIKQVLMMCFMGWMSGNSIQIFSILITLQLISSPLSAISSSGEMFPHDDEWKQLDVTTPRLLYCLIFVGQFVFGLYKLNNMGLLPVYPSDWISTMAVPEFLEYAFSASR